MVVAIFLVLCQRIRSLGWLGTLFAAGVLASVGTIIVLGAQHFDRGLIAFPEGAFKLDRRFLLGVGAATSVAVYDYLGYYNICFLGEEVRKPATTIPRAVMLSILVVVSLYVGLNLSMIGVVPWQEAVTEGTLANKNIAAAFMTKLYGERAAAGFTCLIIFTCIAGLFAMTLGYSRIIYAAAKNGDFFSFFARLHPTRDYPWAALALLSALTAFFCFFDLSSVVEGAVVVRILVQFIGQIVALYIVHREKKHPLPFRMWLYPLPSLVALVGWVLLLATADVKLLLLTAGVYATGLMAFVLRERMAPSTA